MSARNIVAAIFFAIIAIFLIYSVSNYSDIHDFGDLFEISYDGNENKIVL